MRKALSISVTLLLVACGPLGGSRAAEPNTDQLLHSARQTYQSALSYHMSVSFTLAGKHYRAEIDVHRPDAQGTEDVDDLHVEFMQAGGALFRRGHDFFQQTSGDRVARLVGDSWVRASDAQLAADFQRLLDSRLLDDFQGHHGSVKPSGQTSLHGYQTEKLLDGSRTFFVASKGPGYLVRLQDPQGKYLEEGATNLILDFFDYGKPVTVTAPAGFVDLNDPSTLPALFIPDRPSADCDRSGCNMKATVRNDGGPGTSSAEFTLESGGSVIDRCTAPIAASPYKATQEISCRISSSAWTGWWDSHPGSAYQFRVKASNPAYQ